MRYRRSRRRHDELSERIPRRPVDGPIEKPGIQIRIPAAALEAFLGEAVCRGPDPQRAAAGEGGGSAGADCEAASALGHDDRLVDSGRMPGPVRLGALVRWSLVSLESWIREGCPLTSKSPTLLVWNDDHAAPPRHPREACRP